MFENSASLTLLVIAMIATFNCIVRSDYNLVIALVCYFFWLSRYDKEGRVSYVVSINSDLRGYFGLQFRLDSDKLRIGCSWKAIDEVSVSYKR